MTRTPTPSMLRPKKPHNAAGDLHTSPSYDDDDDDNWGVHRTDKLFFKSLNRRWIWDGPYMMRGVKMSIWLILSTVVARSRVQSWVITQTIWRFLVFNFRVPNDTTSATEPCFFLFFDLGNRLIWIPNQVDTLSKDKRTVDWYRINASIINYREKLHQSELVMANKSAKQSQRHRHTKKYQKKNTKSLTRNNKRLAMMDSTPFQMAR